MIITKKYKGIRDYKKLRKLLLKEERWSFGGNESGLEKKAVISVYLKSILMMMNCISM